MEILWKIEEDTANDRIDPDDLLGEITLVSDMGIVQDKNTYLDDWFNALIAGYMALKNGEELVECDLICEPNPICFKLEQTGLRISYKNSIIFVNTLEEFRIQLLFSARKLLQAIERSSPEKSMAPLQMIKDFVSSQP